MELGEIQNILRNAKSIAVYGFSKNPNKVAHTIPVFLSRHGYSVFGINPQPFEVDGIKVYSTLSEIPNEIDILNVFRPSEFCFDVAKEAVERKKEHGDIKALWLQEGIINDDAKALAEANGIVFIQDTCIFKIFQTL
ncbi:MAG: CoA-binding protein [Candidatus Kapaibacteriales bacterium]